MITVYQNEFVCMKERHVRPQMKDNTKYSTKYSTIIFKSYTTCVCMLPRVNGCVYMVSVALSINNVNGEYGKLIEICIIIVLIQIYLKFLITLYFLNSYNFFVDICVK